MNGNAKILFFCMIFVGTAAFGQQINKKLLIYNDLYKTKAAVVKYPIAVFSGQHIKKMSWEPAALTINKSAAGIAPVMYPLLNPAYYAQHLGFFCKKELQIEKRIKIPFKFRLGSVQYCDWMEGKPNAVK